MDIYTTTIAISIAIYIAIGSYAGRGVNRLDDYYVAGRRAPTLIIVGTLVASWMSSTMFAMSWFVVYVSLGIWAAKVFKREYSPSS